MQTTTYLCVKMDFQQQYSFVKFAFQKKKDLGPR